MDKPSQAVTLWLPELAEWIRARSHSELSALKLPALQTLLAKADIFPAEMDDFYARSCYLFHQTHTLPIAATMAAVQLAGSSQDFWIRADPVQMVADRDSLVMIPPQDLANSLEESEALFALFNQHFREDGVQLEWGSHQDWYCRLPQAIDLKTTNLADAAYQNVNHLYPQGTAARYWHQLINETQMLFYTHPVNEARRDQGRPEINSLWFWGAGKLDTGQMVSREGVTIWSDNLYLNGLAKLTQAKSQVAVKNNQAWSNLASKSRSDQHLIHIDGLAEMAATQSAEDLLLQLEKDWFEPLLAQLKQQQIHSLLLDFGGEKRFHLSPKHLQRFWRFRKSILHSV